MPFSWFLTTSFTKSKLRQLFGIHFCRNATAYNLQPNGRNEIETVIKAFIASDFG